jgi:hypothetical protein
MESYRHICMRRGDCRNVGCAALNHDTLDWTDGVVEKDGGDIALPSFRPGWSCCQMK